VRTLFHVSAGLICTAIWDSVRTADARRALTQLRRLGGCERAKRLIFQEAAPEGLHYGLGAGEFGAGPIFGGDWAGSSSLSLSRSSASSGSGWV